MILFTPLKGRNHVSTFIKSLLFAFAITAATPAMAQVPVVYFDFESNSSRDTISETTVEFNSTANTVTFSPTGGVTTTSGSTADGVNGGRSYSSNGWPKSSTDPGTSATDYIEFSLNATAFSGLSFSVDAKANNNGNAIERLGLIYYDGTNWNSGLTNYVLTTTYDNYTWDLSSIAAINNNSNLKFRLYMYDAQNGRRDLSIDNVTIYAKEVNSTVTFDDLNKVKNGLYLTEIPSYDSLKINGLNIGVTLSSDLNIGKALNFADGNMILGSNNITLLPTAALIGGGENSYASTNSTGRLVVPVMLTKVSYPVGSGSYTPATVNPGIGSTDTIDFSVGVINGVTQDDGVSIVNTDGVNKTWNINVEAGYNLSGYTIELQWNTSEEMPGFTPANSLIATRNSLNGTWVGLSSVGSPSNGTVSNSSIKSHTYTSNFTGNNYYTITSNLNALPVELITFNGSLQKQNVVLNWQTASETNNKLFEIERSVNGTNFMAIGQVKGNGTTQQLSQYMFLDNSVPTAAVVYYRLRQVDFNGTFEYSNVIAIRKGNDFATVTLFPNPANNVLNISVNAASQQRTTVRIMDISGRVAMQQIVTISEGKNIQTISIDALSKGTYFIQVTNNEVHIQQSFIKN